MFAINRHLNHFVASLLLGLICLGQLMITIDVAIQLRDGSDFSVLYYSAKKMRQQQANDHVVTMVQQPNGQYDILSRHPHFRQGKLTTQPPLKPATVLKMRNLNTPLATSLLIPLTLLPLKSAVMLWVALSYAMMLITVWLFSHILGLTWQKKPISLSLFLCAAGSFTPYYINLNLGQMGCLTLLMLTLFWRFSRQHPHSLLIKSIWIGLLTAIKPFFGLFALPLIKQQKKSIFWLMAATVFFSLFPLLWLGHHSIPSFLSSLLTAFHDQRTLTKLLSPLNGSIISTLCKLNPYILGSIHFNATFSYLLSLPIIWGLLRFLWQQLQPSLAKKTDHIDYYFSILTTSLMLINPVGWQYYCGFLMIPLVVAAKQYLKQPRPGLPIIFAVALFLINIAQPTQPKFLELLAHHPGLTYDLPIEHYLGLFLGQTLLLVTLVMGHQKPTSSAVQHKQPLSLSLRQQQLMMAVILGISPAILNMLHQVF